MPIDGDQRHLDILAWRRWRLYGRRTQRVGTTLRTIGQTVIHVPMAPEVQGAAGNGPQQQAGSLRPCQQLPYLVVLCAIDFTACKAVLQEVEGRFALYT